MTEPEHMKIKLYILIVFIIAGITDGYCNDDIVSVATLEDYAPFCHKISEKNCDGLFHPGSDSTGFEGYSWDILRESFHSMGFSIKLSVVPWARALNSVLIGNVDILFPTGKNSTRQKIFHYSHEPVNHSKFLIYVRKDDPIIWNGLKSLHGLTIGMKRGFNYGDKWEAATDIRKIDVNTIHQGFRMLDHYRLNGFIGYETTWDFFLKKYGWEDKYRKLPVFDSTNEYLVALKTNPRSIELLKIFDSGKRKLYQTGKLKEIEERWFQKKE